MGIRIFEQVVEEDDFTCDVSGIFWVTPNKFHEEQVEYNVRANEVLASWLTNIDWMLVFNGATTII